MTVADRQDRPVPLDVRVVESAGWRALVVDLGAPHEVLSWAIVNGGRRRATSVAWREVRRGELGPSVDAAMLMRRTLDGLQAPDAVGLMTARDVRCHDVERVARGGVEAACVATIGLGNLLAVGDEPAAGTARVGTINVLCRVSVGLTEEALIEACALVAEARTAAVLAAGLQSPLSARPATGTGTDCIVVAAPSVADREPFAGKHTACGSAIGAAVFGAVGRGVARWMEENRCPGT
jgi:adenosylcobinamide amidohydrolase